MQCDKATAAAALISALTLSTGALAQTRPAPNAPQTQMPTQIQKVQPTTGTPKVTLVFPELADIHSVAESRVYKPGDIVTLEVALAKPMEMDTTVKLVSS